MWATAKRRFGAIATIAGVLFVGYQYFDGKWKARIERSLHYILMYQESDKVAARNEIDLQPPNVRQRDFELDPIVLEKLKELQGTSDPVCVEKYVSASIAGLSDKPTPE